MLAALMAPLAAAPVAAEPLPNPVMPQHNVRDVWGFLFLGCFVLITTSCTFFQQNPIVSADVYSQATDERIVHVELSYESFGGDTWLAVPPGDLVNLSSSEEPILKGSVDEFTSQCQLVGRAEFGRVTHLVVTLPDAGPPSANTNQAVPSITGHARQDALTNVRC